MGRQSTPSFVTELPLMVTPVQEKTILARFTFARQIYNAVLGESLRRLALMRQSKRYQAARRIPKTEANQKLRTKTFGEIRKDFGFTEYATHAWVGHYGTDFPGLGSWVIQMVATRAFKAVMRYAVGKGGKPRFKGANQWDSVESKGQACLSWNGKSVVWMGLTLPAIFPNPKKKGNDVIEHGLNSRVKYARLLRRKLNGKNRFYVQLVCEGQPYRKPRNPIGKGLVGLDIGPSTIAIVAPEAKKAKLTLFCAELKSRQDEIRHLQRKLDRQRRTNNPLNYNENGTVKKGAKKWVKSQGYRKTQDKLAEIHRQQTAHRKSLHGRLANEILAFGTEIRTEKLSYRAFQKNFGKSVGVRAPGMFVDMLTRKAESAGGAVTEFPTRTTKLSQVCLCGEVKKKPLSQRWHICECGVEAQRDLFSAFLASCVEDGKLNAELAKELWHSGMDACLRAALRDVQPASGGEFPVSFGIGRRQSGSPVIEPKGGEAQEVVTNGPLALARACESHPDARPPRL